MSSAATCTTIDQPFAFRRPSPFPVALAIVWTLMIFTFSISDDAPGGASLDSIVSRLKYGLRGCAAIVLTVMCVRRVTVQWLPSATLVFAPLLMFVGWALLSTTWSARFTDSLTQAVNLLVLSLLSICIAQLCRTADDVQRLARHLCAALLALSAGLLLLRFCVPSLHVMERFGSGLFHATNTAATASLGLVLLVAARSLWNAGWAKQLLIPAIPIHLGVLLLSANRLSLAITVGLVGILALRSTHRFLLTLGIFCACVVGALYLTVDPGFAIAGSLGESIGSYASRGQSSAELSAFSGREEMWTAIWSSFLESPWKGHGYFVSSASGTIEVWYVEGNWTAHNVTLQVLVSTGIIGFLLLSAGILLPTGFAVRRLLSGSRHSALPLLLLILACWFGAWGLMNESFMGPLQPESVIFFSVLGMAVGRAAGLRQSVGPHDLTHREAR